MNTITLQQPKPKHQKMQYMITSKKNYNQIKRKAFQINPRDWMKCMFPYLISIFQKWSSKLWIIIEKISNLIFSHLWIIIEEVVIKFLVILFH